jgi:hypothetical protein
MAEHTGGLLILGNLIPLGQQFGILVMHNWEQLALASYTCYKTKGRNAIVMRTTDIQNGTLIGYSTVIDMDLEEFQAPVSLVDDVNTYDPKYEIIAALLHPGENDIAAVEILRLRASNDESRPENIFKASKGNDN